MSLSSVGSNDIFLSSFSTAPMIPALGPLGLATIAGGLGLVGWRRMRRKP